MNEILLLALLTVSPSTPLTTVADTVRAPAAMDTLAADSTLAGAPRPAPAGIGASAPRLPVAVNPAARLMDSDSALQGRARAISYSEWYGRRLTIHRLGSYTMLPLFATEYWLGNKLMNDLELASWVRPAHGTVASGLGVLFGVNTVTGLWNLWDARHDPNDRARRTIHVVTMLAADAGFLYTASLAGDDDGGPTNAQPHKNAALASIGISTLGTAMMWIWKK